MKMKKGKVNFKDLKLNLKKFTFSMLGIFLTCLGVAFNNNTGLGNDPVGMVYDGLRVAFNIPILKLGYVSNFLNIGLMLILLLIGRRYLNIGTLMYLLPYGLFVTFGSNLYVSIFPKQTWLTSSLGGLLGVSFYYIGISLFVAADIGVDPFNGLMLTLRDISGWSLRKSKVIFDAFLILLGLLLGGKLGLITAITAVTTGPVLQLLSGWFKQKLMMGVT